MLGDEIVTYSGIKFRPSAPDPELIVIEDIAHSLSNQCRFTGHCRKFYSVAEHSIHASTLVPRELKLTALLHDASEAYLTDMARPVKMQLGLGEIYRELEGKLMAVIAEKFGIIWPMPDKVVWADDVMLRSEQRDLMPDLLRYPGDDYFPVTIDPWLPEETEEKFLNLFEIYKEYANDNRAIAIA